KRRRRDEHGQHGEHRCCDEHRASRRRHDRAAACVRRGAAAHVARAREPGLAHVAAPPELALTRAILARGGTVPSALTRRGIVKQRMNLAALAPGAYKAMLGFETYLASCSL